MNNCFSFIHLTTIRIFLPAILVCTQVANAAEGLLTLKEAEKTALRTDPVTRSLEARSESYTDQAVADGQLPDPRLRLGAANFPVDSFSRAQEAMTQLQVGIQQSFPPGKTLQYRMERTEAFSELERERARARSLEVLRDVRIKYLQLYYQYTAQDILEENRVLFAKLTDITERQYAAGRDNQHDVLRSKLELSLIDDRILEVIQARESTTAELGKYIGAENAARQVQQDYPALPHLPSQESIRENLVVHPLVKIEDAAIRASRKSIREAEEQYKPGFNIDVTYGERTGRSFAGDSRPDLLSAMLMIDLPVFTDKRQDRRLSAAKKRKAARQFTRADRLLQLGSMAERERTNWNRLEERLQLFEQRAASDARMNVESTLNAYQNDVTDFTTLMRAYLTELNTRLDMLRIRVEKSKVHSKLLYLAGEL